MHAALNESFIRGPALGKAGDKGQEPTGRKKEVDKAASRLKCISSITHSIPLRYDTIRRQVK